MRMLAILFVLLTACAAETIPTKAPRPPCTPNCLGAQCGSDGCGGTCGTCDVGRTCQGNICVDDSCRPSCTGYECGDDGCGGSCGTCRTGTCINHTCVDQTDDCQTRTYTATTCSLADPCGWVGNGICDDDCATSYPASHFDDSADCTTTTPCNGECAAGLDTTCTCSAADPCERVGDGVCQSGCATYFPADHFDDSVDCVTTPCSGQCAAEEYTACTCGSADPCGWAGDGSCDNYCPTNFPSDHFDDSADCSGGACGGECVDEQYTSCTCGSTDPCGWQNDGSCDDYCVINFPGDYFADTVDCSCAEDCAAELWNACTCAASDPCGWSNDGFCDSYCADNFPINHFDDGTDCDNPPTCGTECTQSPPIYTACTCGTTDPCAWIEDGACDDYCAYNFGTYFDDSVDCACYGECDALSYTACTCSSLDICGWINDGYCDEECATLYPGDHFVDSAADCP